MKQIAALAAVLWLMGSVSAYNQSIVNVSERTDGSDLGKRGVDTVVLMVNQSNMGGLADYVVWGLFVGLILLLVSIFEPRLIRRVLGGGR